MELILKDYSWDMDGYVPRSPQGDRGKLTLRDAYMAYHVLPSPPPIQPGGSTDDYIRLAQETHELKYVFFYLHENERYFNDRINRFLCSETNQISPYRLMDLKLACREEVLRRFPNYDSDRGTTFLTYIHRYITDVLLRFRMTEESYSFDSLQEYKDARHIMQLFHECRESVNETVRVFAEQNSCTEKRLMKSSPQRGGSAIVCFLRPPMTRARTMSRKTIYFQIIGIILPSYGQAWKRKRWIRPSGSSLIVTKHCWNSVMPFA